MLTDVDPAVRVRLGMDRVTGRPRGFAFAEFSDAARAADAIRRFDAFELRGRRLGVNDADDKPPPRAPRPTAASSPRRGSAARPSRSAHSASRSAGSPECGRDAGSVRL